MHGRIISSVKTEHRAITKVRELIDKLEYLDYSFSENDKKISFDGTIDLYNDKIDLKTSWAGSVKVQIKGRTKYKDPTQKDKINFNLDKKDLDNFLKVDGAILIVVNFYEKDITKYSIYINALLPADIVKIQDENKSNSAKEFKLGLKQINGEKDLEKICRTFKINQDIQKGKLDLIDNNFTMKSSYITKFFIWDFKDFVLEDLIGSTQYLYTYDSKQKLVNICSQEIGNLITKSNITITDKNKEIIFDHVVSTTTKNEKTISFGKSFNLNIKESKFNIKIQGTFCERIKALEFVRSVYINNGFLINGKLFSLNIEDTFEEKFGKLYCGYKFIEDFFNDHSITKDLNFDLWSDEDFRKLNIIISSIKNERAIKFNDSSKSMIGSYQIKDLSISILAVKRKDGLFDTYSIWNSKKSDGNFKITIPGNHDILCNNKFMVLNKESYLSDDINYNEMKESFNNLEYNADNKILLNLQVLNLIDSYDKNSNIELLNYANWLTDKLLDHSDSDDRDVYFINKCQISKRLGLIPETDKEKLYKLKEMSSDSLIKISCYLLLDYYDEANAMIKSLDESTLNTLKEFPISKYIECW